MITSIATNMLWTQGQEIIGFVLLIAVIGIWWRPAWYAALALFLFSFYFFRNPERICRQALQDNTVLVSPSDGQVVDIQYDTDNSIEGYAQKVAIFLSPLDVHVNWIPIDGTIAHVAYHPGTFTFAFLPKSSILNERNDIIIRRPNDQTFVVRQIAGTIARRLCCWVHTGDTVTTGQRYGMIKFGSRVELLLPANVTLAVGLGQKVVGGQTVLGHWN